MKAAALLIAAIALLQQPPRDTWSAPPETGTAAIRGRVVASDTGAPIRYATVTLSRREPSLRRSTSTDPLGRFSFDGVPAGSFLLTARPAATSPYLETTFGGSSAQPRRGIDVADGQVVTNIEIKVDAAATISGRVVDDNAEPLARIRVQAIGRSTGSRPQRLGGAETDDQGRFRVFGLRPGVVMVLAEAPIEYTSGNADSIPMLVDTYYPQSTSAIDARTFRVRAGTRIDDIELAMIRTRTFHVSGVVLNSRGLPATDGPPPLLDHRTILGGWANQIHLGSDGRFTMAGLVPGAYEIVVRPQPQTAGEYATASFTVGDADVDDLVITTKPAFDLAGRVTFDPQPPEATPGGIRIVPYTAGGEVLWGMQATVQPDASFTLIGIFGQVLLRPQGGPIEVGLKGVFLGNQDITDIPTEFGPDDAARLRIAMTTRPSAIGGLVMDDRDAPTREYVVVLFPADRTAWIPASSRVQTATPDRLGRFHLIRVRPGRYRIAALPAFQSIEPTANNTAPRTSSAWWI
ncbi:MAG: hypothetical protein DMF86_02635 [Acidobacteria bacterium]|nr:MAG: hypothetical protein DMF86_02635 [Acidobacteriota bacterium]